jgi:hypothetical protein
MKGGWGKPRIPRLELEGQFIGNIKLGTNIFVRQLNIHSFENQMNVIINV